VAGSVPVGINVALSGMVFSGPAVIVPRNSSLVFDPQADSISASTITIGNKSFNFTWFLHLYQ
jgi:hypothetical protein